MDVPVGLMYKPVMSVFRLRGDALIVLLLFKPSK